MKEFLSWTFGALKGYFLRWQKNDERWEKNNKIMEEMLCRQHDNDLATRGTQILLLIATNPEEIMHIEDLFYKYRSDGGNGVVCVSVEKWRKKCNCKKGQKK